MEPLDLPPLNFKTMGLWYIVPEDIKEKYGKRGKRQRY